MMRGIIPGAETRLGFSTTAVAGLGNGFACRANNMVFLTYAMRYSAHMI